MEEGTPVVPLLFQLTFVLSCRECYIVLEVTDHVGLTLSNCSLNFTMDTTSQQLQLRAVRTPGSNSRIVTLKFRTTVYGPTSAWQGYSQPDIRVTLSTSFIYLRFKHNMLSLSVCF